MRTFTAPLWARNPHCQTLLGALIDRVHSHPLNRERVRLPDGDFIDLDWLVTPKSGGSTVLILHGLEGSSRSPYIHRLLAACQTRQWPAVVMHFRGCSGEPNRLARGYHGGETQDLDAIIGHLKSRSPKGLCVVGYSLGGGVLLKWLGEQGHRTGLLAAAAVSVPFNLESAAERLNRGFSRVYQWVLLRWLKRSIKRKALSLGQGLPPLRALTHFRAFDDAITAPLHGFSDASDYYQKASCRPYLRGIAVPTLLIQAADDPFFLSTNLPSPDELSPQIQFELSAHGGHVGFIAGGWPWAPRFWLDERLGAFLSPYMATNEP